MWFSYKSSSLFVGCRFLFGFKEVLFFLFHIGRVMRKCVFEHMRTAKAQSACASAQSGQGLHCPLTIIRHYRRYMYQWRANARMTAYARNDPESVHFHMLKDTFFAWRDPYNHYF